MQKLINKQGGFTIIELLVVIVIIGILVALLLPNLFTAQQRARDTERKNDLSTIQTQLETYYNDNSEYPANIYEGGLDGYVDEVPTDPQGDEEYGYETVDGTGGTVQQYTLVATLENENDPDAGEDGRYEVGSVNQAPAAGGGE